MESNNRRNVFAHDDIDYLLGSIIVTYPFPILLFCQNSFAGSSLHLHSRCRLLNL